MKENPIVYTLAYLIVLLAVLTAVSFLFLLGWTFFVVPIFGAPPVSFWQAFTAECLTLSIAWPLAAMGRAK